MTLTNFCREIKNWFEVENGRHFGTFDIINNTISLDFLQEGQYFRIIGSVFNDGVYQYPATDLVDEEFNGAIWAMAVPDEVITLVNDISDWVDANADVLNSPYQSESFGGYAYSKESGASSNGASVTTWQGHFASQLNKWRKI